MKHPSLYTLILLAVILHYGSSSGSDGVCTPLFVTVEATAIIRCPVTKNDQDGVYLYRQVAENMEKQTVTYYYQEGTLTPEEPFKGRVETNNNFGNFSVFLKNVSKHDGGVYWCHFNKGDIMTDSDTKICLLVQSGTIVVYKEESKLIFWAVIGGLSFFILFLLIILVKLCHDRGNYTTKQQPSNGVYEVMRGNTGKALINPAYESGRR
ncbi:hypothetical protein KOW79_010466 [Hemibagrus wyckioides]|uniref:Immunoglobulin V-set domain-containing protein n=1 Tax=Hemibagrus wyckioides TaxID=337641 RepID=A0A9D3SKL2_9TELE|nr:uncharacterized protein LOC131362225 [Hemibagrus wyckioides]KAG7327065.1 hypothetical protein KOW79_010466 [Hemibagrus wyckioides]